MKIHKWLNNPNSAINGIAIVEVEAGEKPTIEDFLKIIDGDSVGHFGYSVSLISEETPPKIKYRKKYGWEAESQFGFRNASEIEKIRRYYKVFVHRD